MIRTFISTFALAAMVSLPAAAAEPAAWDQQAALAAAKSLEETVLAIHKSINLRDGGIQARQNKTYLVSEDLRSLGRFAKRLRVELENGSTREETKPLFTRAMRLVDRLRVSMPGTPSFENEAERVHVARAQLEVLAPMYGVTLPPPVATPAKEN
jgi:hypothetical protein